MSVSNHAVILSATDYDRYLQKLKLQLGDNIINLPDPYNLSDGWHTGPNKLSPFSTTWTFIATLQILLVPFIMGMHYVFTSHWMHIISIFLAM